MISEPVLIKVYIKLIPTNLKAMAIDNHFNCRLQYQYGSKQSQFTGIYITTMYNYHNQTMAQRTEQLKHYESESDSSCNILNMPAINKMIKERKRNAFGRLPFVTNIACTWHFSCTSIGSRSISSIVIGPWYIANCGGGPLLITKSNANAVVKWPCNQ